MADNGEVTIVGAGRGSRATSSRPATCGSTARSRGRSTPRAMSLSPQSQVEADIRAQNVSIAGRFKEFDQRERQGPPRRGGRIDGDITSKTLVVEEGGVFHGQSIMDGSSQPEAARGGCPAPPRSGPTRVPRAPKRRLGRCSTSSGSARIRSRSASRSAGAAWPTRSTSCSRRTSGADRSRPGSRSCAPSRTGRPRRSAPPPATRSSS